MTIKYTDDVIRNIAAKVAKEMMADGNDMQNYMLMDVVEALEKGEDVDDGLADLILTRPFMERFIDELLKYEE
jgi:hypothetical protein